MTESADFPEFPDKDWIIQNGEEIVWNNAIGKNVQDYAWLDTDNRLVYDIDPSVPDRWIVEYDTDWNYFRCWTAGSLETDEFEVYDVCEEFINAVNEFVEEIRKQKGIEA
jgi:hypothetical protein